MKNFTVNLEIAGWKYSIKILFSKFLILIFFAFWPPCTACGMVPWPGVELRPPQRKHQFLTSRPPGNSQESLFLEQKYFNISELDNHLYPGLWGTHFWPEVLLPQPQCLNSPIILHGEALTFAGHELSVLQGTRLPGNMGKGKKDGDYLVPQAPDCKGKQEEGLRDRSSWAANSLSR